MVSDVFARLKALHEESLSWKSNLVFPQNGKEENYVDVTCAVNGSGTAAVCPPCATDQPTIMRGGSLYAFSSEFKGPEGFDPLFDMIQKSTPQCKLFVQRRAHKTKFKHEYDIRCNCYKLRDIGESDFEDGCFAKKGTKPETVKQKRTSGQATMVDRFPSKKLKDPKNKKRKTRDNRSHTPISRTANPKIRQ